MQPSLRQWCMPMYGRWVHSGSSSSSSSVILFITACRRGEQTHTHTHTHTHTGWMPCRQACTQAMRWAGSSHVLMWRCFPSYLPFSWPLICMFIIFDSSWSFLFIYFINPLFERHVISAHYNCLRLSNTSSYSSSEAFWGFIGDIRTPAACSGTL